MCVLLYPSLLFSIQTSFGFMLANEKTLLEAPPCKAGDEKIIFFFKTFFIGPHWHRHGILPFGFYLHGPRYLTPSKLVFIAKMAQTAKLHPKNNHLANSHGPLMGKGEQLGWGMMGNGLGSSNGSSSAQPWPAHVTPMPYPCPEICFQ